MASTALPGARVDVDSLVGLANRALRLNTWDELQKAARTLIEAKRKLDGKDLDFPGDHRILYDHIGRLQEAMGDLEAEDGDRIDITALVEDAEEALMKNSVPALVGVRKSLQQAIDRAKAPTYQRRLRRLIRGLNEALDKLNDEQARRLLRQFNEYSLQVWDAVDGVDCFTVSALHRSLLETAQQITGAKPCLRFAIDRVEKATGGWKTICEQVSQSIANTRSMMDGLETEVGKLHLVKAKELASRFEACMDNGNVGGALAALRELASVRNAAGLASHLGSTAECDRFMENARRRLSPLAAKHLLRKVRRLAARLTA